MKREGINYRANPAIELGGGLFAGKRKQQRPFHRSGLIHVTMRAEQAKGRWSMLARKHKGFVYLEGDRIARESKVRLRSFVNVGNHIHIVVKAKRKRDLQRFLRVITGRIACLVTGAKKGKPLRKRFWDLLVHSKLVISDRQEKNLSRYTAKNLGEAEGPRVLLVSDFIEIRSG
jgi:REP element-mobilizing transposase RayT